jgi:signal transduction histidine kinase
MTDSEASTAARDATGLSGRKRRKAVAVAGYAAAPLVGVRRAAVTALRRAAKPWLRRSLRRRLVAALAIMSLIGCLGIVASGETLDHLFFNDGFQYCGGLRGYLLALPGPDGGCSAYSSSGQVTSVIIMIAGLALITWSWWLLADWALSPLSVTAETVRRLGPQNLAQRIGLSGGEDRFKELADAIDDALDRLAAGYESQRRFAANASHELRTPLAVQRLLTEVALDDPQAGDDLRRLGAQLLRTNEHSEQLIEGMLTLAESDRGLQATVPVRLDELAGNVIGQHDELAASHQLTLRRTLTAATVAGDPVLLERLIANLLSNAIKYNEPGGWIETEVSPGTGGRGGTLIVRNTGAPVPAEAVPALFEPFRRLGADRVAGKGGAGLGLAIVRSIVTAHQANLQARPRQAGGIEIAIDIQGK